MNLIGRTLLFHYLCQLTNILETEKRGDKRLDKRIKRRHSPSPAPNEHNKKRKKWVIISIIIK